MPTLLDVTLSVVIATLAAGGIVASVARNSFRRHFYVNLSLAVMLFCDGLRYIALYRYGFSSPQYFYAFYLTDALLVTATYLLILSFFEVIFGNTPLRSPVRQALLCLVVLMGLMSYAMISESLPHFYSRLVVEFLQNMYFAAVLLAVLLWIALKYLRVDDRQMGLLIAGLGLSLSVQAANYALQNLLPRDLFVGWGVVMRRVPAIATMLKVGVWCYAMAAVTGRVPLGGREPAVSRLEVEGTA